MNDELTTKLVRFSDKLNIPAVAGGYLINDGTRIFDVVGVQYRGSDSKAKLEDQWHIGSCAKSITAVLYAKLVEQGLAEWNSPVAALFPDLSREISKSWNERTIEDLFLCRAGMRANPDRSDMIAAYIDTRSPQDQRTDAAIAAMHKPPNPGGRFVYSNLSYIVIGAAIDRITGTPFEQALSTLVLEPLGIESLGYGPPESIWGQKGKSQLGGLILFTGKPANPQDSYSDNPRVFSSAGTMHLTVEDWAKFLSIFLSSNNMLLNSDTINYLLSGSEDTKASMLKGWSRIDGLKNVSYGMQGSNTMWTATALISDSRTKIGFLICNDGRTRVLSESANLAADLINTHYEY